MIKRTRQRIFVAGHTGMLGSSIVRSLAKSQRSYELITWTSRELDLRDYSATRAALMQARPDVVVMAAGHSGGIGANALSPVELLNDNVAMQTNIFRTSHEADVARVLFIGSSCMYPRSMSTPIPEDALLSGQLESTSEAFAVAKLAGLMAVRAYRTQYRRRWIAAVPASLYGPNDNLDPASSHVLAGVMRKTHEAMLSGADSVVLWGSGSPRREFLYVDDMADACLWLIDHYDSDLHINLGPGVDHTIRELSGIIAEIVGFSGSFIWDESMPEGTPRKLLDSTRARKLGWSPRIEIRDGIERMYSWYLQAVAASSTRGPNSKGLGQ